MDRLALTLHHLHPALALLCALLLPFGHAARSADVDPPVEVPPRLKELAQTAEERRRRDIAGPPLEEGAIVKSTQAILAHLLNPEDLVGNMADEPWTVAAGTPMEVLLVRPAQGRSQLQTRCWLKMGLPGRIVWVSETDLLGKCALVQAAQQAEAERRQRESAQRERNAQQQADEARRAEKARQEGEARLQAARERLKTHPEGGYHGVLWGGSPDEVRLSLGVPSRMRDNGDWWVYDADSTGRSMGVQFSKGGLLCVNVHYPVNNRDDPLDIIRQLTEKFGTATDGPLLETTYLPGGGWWREESVLWLGEDGGAILLLLVTHLGTATCGVSYGNRDSVSKWWADTRSAAASKRPGL